MRILGKKWWTLAAALPVAALVACTSNSPVEVVTPKGQVYSEDEYEELVDQGLVDEVGNVIEEDEEVTEGADAQKSSSSGSKTTSSSDSKTASSSDTKTESSSDSKTTSSDSKTESSSSAKASSDSGSDKSSSSTAPASSATGDKSSSSSAVAPESSSSSVTAPASSSSSAAAPVSSSGTTQPETGCGTSECSIGTNAMDEVDAETKTELDSLKELIDNGGVPVGFEELPEGLTGETFNYNFLGENDVYCFTGEGEWLHVVREELGKYINHFKNGAAWGQLEKFEIIFSESCAEVYFRPKS